MTTIARDRVKEALGRIHNTLVAAAGADKRLSRAEVKQCLTLLAPTERAAVDAFAGALSAEKKRGGVITVRDIERAIALATTALVPEGGSDSVSADDVVRASRFGDGLVGLARRLAGEPAAQLPVIPAAALEGKEGDELVSAVRALCSPHIRFEYGAARDLMYTKVDVESGRIVDRYTRREAPPTTRQALEREHHINAEHTRPQSEGVKGTPAKSDLHHLFPTDSEANAKRGNLPFGVVVNVLWEKSGSRLGENARGDLVFEPPGEHKGDVARALFYVAAIYGLELEPGEEEVLRAWHRLDPVDERERKRNDAIAAHQENRNPFVDLPGLVDKIKDF